MQNAAAGTGAAAFRWFPPVVAGTDNILHTYNRPLNERCIGNVWIPMRSVNDLLVLPHAWGWTVNRANALMEDLGAQRSLPPCPSTHRLPSLQPATR